jgi:DNA-binding HxlR family transcriptional regulator
MNSDPPSPQACADEMAADGSHPGGSKRPYEVVRHVLGSKWHLQIIRQLLYTDSIRFNVLKSKVGPSSKMLSESLSTLEDAGVVERTVVQERPPEVEYSLTSAGRELEGIVQDALRWAIDHGGAVED